ncbi:hypothetical protein ACOMHN_028402 [Nucella lapillus]
MIIIELASCLAACFPSSIHHCSPYHRGRGRRGERGRAGKEGEGRGGGWRSVAGAGVSYFFGYVVVTLMVTGLKVTTGELRPHFLHVCRPAVDWLACNYTTYISEYNCTNGGTEEEKRLILNARQSFPSGHAAYAVYMALFMIVSPFISQPCLTHLFMIVSPLYPSPV